MIGYDGMSKILLDQGAVQIKDGMIAFNSFRWPEHDKGPYLYIHKFDETGDGKQISLSKDECVKLRDWLTTQIDSET